MTGNVCFPNWCDAELCAAVTKDQTDIFFAYRQYTNQYQILLILWIKNRRLSKKWTAFVLFVSYSLNGLI